MMRSGNAAFSPGFNGYACPVECLAGKFPLQKSQILASAEVADRRRIYDKFTIVCSYFLIQRLWFQASRVLAILTKDLCCCLFLKTILILLLPCFGGRSPFQDRWLNCKCFQARDWTTSRARHSSAATRAHTSPHRIDNLGRRTHYLLSSPSTLLLHNPRNCDLSRQRTDRHPFNSHFSDSIDPFQHFVRQA